MVAPPADAPSADTDLRERAARLLEERFAAIDLPGSGLTEAHAQRLMGPMRDFQTGAAAAAACGALTVRESAEWQERLHERVAVAAGVKRAPQATFAEVVRVLAGPEQRREGLRIASVELYSDGVAVRWHLTAPSPGPIKADADEDERERAMRAHYAAHHIELELGDDVGTEYSPAGGGSCGGGGATETIVAMGSAQFVPAVPSDATRLEVCSGDRAFVIELAG